MVGGHLRRFRLARNMLLNVQAAAIDGANAVKVCALTIATNSDNTQSDRCCTWNFLQDRYNVAADGVSINSIGFKAWF